MSSIRLHYEAYMNCQLQLCNKVGTFWGNYICKSYLPKKKRKKVVIKFETAVFLYR